MPTKITFTMGEIDIILKNIVKNDFTLDDFDVDKLYMVTKHGHPSYTKASLLFYACRNRNFAAMEKLIDLGADPNIGDSYYGSPLCTFYHSSQPFFYMAQMIRLIYACSEIKKTKTGGDYDGDGMLLCMTYFNLESVRRPAIRLTGSVKYFFTLLIDEYDKLALNNVAYETRYCTIEYTFLLNMMITLW